MTTVAEQDPRAGLGEAIDAFVGWMQEKGIKGTDAALRRIAKRAFVSRATIYNWKSGEHSCGNILTAKAVRQGIEEERKNLAR